MLARMKHSSLPSSPRRLALLSPFPGGPFYLSGLRTQQRAKLQWKEPTLRASMRPVNCQKPRTSFIGLERSFVLPSLSFCRSLLPSLSLCRSLPSLSFYCSLLPSLSLSLSLSLFSPPSRSPILASAKTDSSNRPSLDRQPAALRASPPPLPPLPPPCSAASRPRPPPRRSRPPTPSPRRAATTSSSPGPSTSTKTSSAPWTGPRRTTGTPGSRPSSKSASRTRR